MTQCSHIVDTTSRKIIDIKVKKLYPDVQLPQTANSDDAGLDIRAYFTKEFASSTTCFTLEKDEPIEDRHYLIISTDRPCLLFKPSGDSFDGARLMIPPMTRIVIPTGISTEIPVGYEIQVRSRSGLSAKNGIIVLNAPGTIDSGYRGEYKVIVFNSDKKDFFQVCHGDRIGQLVLNEVPRINWVEISDLSSHERGAGGFGSTGVK